MRRGRGFGGIFPHMLAMRRHRFDHMDPQRLERLRERLDRMDPHKLERLRKRLDRMEMRRGHFGSMVPHLLLMMTRKSGTVLYPAEQAQVADRFRGMLEFEAALCVGCRLCERVCPSNAIKIETAAEKQYRAVVHLDKCIFCGLCVDTCNRKALKNTENFELASDDKASLTVEL